MNENAEQMNVTEIAFVMRVTKATVRSWIDSGELPAVNVARSGSAKAYYRVLRSDLSAFIAKRTPGATTPTDLPLTTKQYV